MRKSVFIRLCALFTVFILAAGFIIAAVLMVNNENALTAEYTALLKTVGETADPADLQNGEQFCDDLAALNPGIRFTLIDESGAVLGDSATDAETLENHLSREEVTGAFQNGSAVSKRYSETTGRSMLYVAYRTTAGSVLRAAVAVSTLDSYLLSLLLPLIACLVVALIIAFILSDSVARSAIRPLGEISEELRFIENGEYEKRLPDTRYDELVPFVRSVNRMADSIEESFKEIETEKSKLELLLNSMRQGLIVTDKEYRIIHENDTARHLLPAPEGADKNRLFLFDLTHQARLLTAVEACVKKGISSLFDMAADGGQTIYSVSVTPLNHHWLQNGALLLFSDVTKDRTAEKMRAEFVSNASHELKTPVTSIRGFAELLNSGLVADEVQREDYLNRILAESDRLSAIIDDILKLASLEEQPAAAPSVPLDVLGAAEAVKEELAPLSESKQVTIETKGDHAMLCMEEDDLMRLLKNLVENAVKYNVPDGSVTVTVEDAPSAVTLRVADTGIGIAENHLPRIFERFYRVDKGRSRSVGGTGLGLSIVKHIANVYEGQIHIESTVGKGTTISIRFPKK